jgi:hypothetical protein
MHEYCKHHAVDAEIADILPILSKPYKRMSSSSLSRKPAKIGNIPECRDESIEQLQAVGADALVGIHDEHVFKEAVDNASSETESTSLLIGSGSITPYTAET